MKKALVVILIINCCFQSFAQENGLGIKMGMPFYLCGRYDSYQGVGVIEKSIYYFHKSENSFITGFKFQSDFFYYKEENSITWSQHVYLIRNYYPSFLFGKEFFIGKLKTQTLLNLGVFATHTTNITYIPDEKYFAISSFFLEPEIKFSLLSPATFDLGIYLSPNFIYKDGGLNYILLSAGIFAEFSILKNKD